MKKLFILIALLVLIPVSIFAKETKSKVKVYLFESGGCPYCEAEIEYLKDLPSYNKKFTIVSKELYVDHIDWEQGKDYKLGKKVAEEFQRAGFEDASYKGTPFVVISDLYAVAGYSTDLEDIIDAAYEEGDKDAVTCISKGKDDCIRLNENATSLSNTTVEEEKNEEVKGGLAIAIIAGVALIGVAIYIIRNSNNSSSFEEESESKEEKPKAKKVAKKTK